MSKHFESRAYQTEVEEAVFDYLLTKTGNPVVAAPGGVGKSLIMNKIIKRMVVDWPGTRVLSVVHDAKVIDQNCNSMLKYWPTAPVGIYSAGLKSRDTLHPIIYAGIQSIAKKPLVFGRLNVVFIDECDLVSPREETYYQKFIRANLEVNPLMRVVGFTATPYRSGMGCLTNSDLWDEICIDLTATDRFNWFIENGFLSPLINKKACVEIDITNVGMRGGEFIEHDLQEVSDTDELNKAVVEECIRYGFDRKHWLVFSSGVKHGERLAKVFQSKGVSAYMLSGEDAMDYREDAEEAFKAGKFRCLINCGLYGRGWDFPALDMIAWARATQSTSLWVQGCVRGTRISNQKSNCLILDFAGNTRRLGPINAPIVPRPRKKGDGEKGECPVKECPECHSYIHPRVMVCPDCGFVFPPPTTVQKNASSDAIMAGGSNPDPVIEEFDVIGIRYGAKKSTKGNEMMTVCHFIGASHFTQYMLFGHPNYVVQKRLKIWWEHRGGLLPVPESVDEAVSRAAKELLIPSKIRVDVAKKFPEIIGCEFDDNSKVLGAAEEVDYSSEDMDIPF